MYSGQQDRFRKEEKCFIGQSQEVWHDDADFSVPSEKSFDILAPATLPASLETVTRLPSMQCTTRRLPRPSGELMKCFLSSQEVREELLWYFRLVLVLLLFFHVHTCICEEFTYARLAEMVA